MQASEIKVSYTPTLKASERVKITRSLDSYAYLNNIVDNIDYCETFILLCLNRSNHVLGHNIISTGGISGTIADPKKIFQIALKTNSSSIIIAHNHPSGNTRPSESDINLTRKIKEAGVFLDLFLLDHLIITSETYFSFADEGLI